MKEKSQDEREQLLCKLEKRLKDDPEFSEADMDEIHELIQAWKGMKSLGKASKWVISSLAMLTGFLASVVALWAVLKGYKPL